VSWVTNAATGRPIYGDRFNTGNIERALLARGFQYGSQPGALNVGWNGGHTAATLPDGTPVSSGEGGGVRIGGAGAYQKQFGRHMFLPMPVEDYLEKCSLWQSGPRRGRGRSGAGERICAPGELTPGRLAQMSAPGPGLALRFVERPLGRRELRAWRRDAGRPRLAGGGGRFAAVGLLSRFIDAVMRVSLLLRGRVPGGTTAAAEQDYRAHVEPDSCPYYGRVSRDRGFIALQYWFFYAMNDWRSTFAGVNDHEADWEQVTVFLPDPPDASQRPAWVAFSSHDETGDDRRLLRPSLLVHS